jgi:hypothetical protein
VITACAILLIAQSVGLRLVDSTRTSPEQAHSILAALRTALEQQGVPAVSVVPAGAVTEPREMVQVTLIGGLTRTRVVAERSAATLSEAHLRCEIDLPEDASTWPPELATMARTLFPDLRAEYRAPPEAAKVDRDLLPILAGFGLGAAFGSLGVASVLRAQQVDQDSRSAFHPPGETADLSARAGRYRAIGIGGVALGVALILGATAWIVFD